MLTARPARTGPRSGRGFTLVELGLALAIAGILATLTLPSIAGAIHTARRSEALIALAQWQLAQERWRGEHPAYADNGADLRLPGSTASGLYRLSVVSADATGFVLRASASGAQAADAACRHLQLSTDAATVLRRSGPDAQVANDDAANRRCWGG